MSKKHISKKQKLLAGVCIPLAAAGVAAGITSIFLTRNNPVTPTKGDYKVSFYTDESSHFIDPTNVEQRVYANTTLDRVNQPAVQSYRANHLFAGWLDEKGNAVPGKYVINRDTKLTASFGDTTTGDYQTITFKTKPDEPASLHGNVSVAVKKGYLFMMVNRPTAEWNDYYFENWQYKEGDTYVDLSESTIIDTDMVLFPKFTKAVTMTWDPGEGGRILRGQPTTRLAAGTIFNKFNQPQLINENLNKVFLGWYKEAAGTTPWKPNEFVEKDTTAYAIWKDREDITEKYHMLQFEQNKETGAAVEVIFAPSTSTVVNTGATWSQATPPSVYTEDGSYELESWEYYNDTTSPEHTTPTWDELTAGHVFTTDKATQKYSTRIRPVMKCSVTGVTISGDDTVLPESNTTYTAVVSGTDKNPVISQSIKWGLFQDKACSKPVKTSVATLDDEGHLTVESITETTSVFIRATSTIDDTQYKVKEVTIRMPYVASQRIWYHKDGQWFSISQKDGLCDGKAEYITSVALNANRGSKGEDIWKYNTFDSKLYVGRQLTELFQQFGYNWYGFNAEIDFGENLTTIKSSFLENCDSFDQPLDLTYVDTIGDNFLCGCTRFGAAGSGETAYDPVITFGDGLSSIGKNFLMNCTMYNRQIELPESNLSIDDGFLYNCNEFNQDITIPANVTDVGDFFMMGCNSFTKTITIASNSTYFVPNIHNISATTSDSDIYNYGFSVEGDGAASFTRVFPTTAGTDDVWRTVKNGVTPVTTVVTKAQWDTAVNKLFNLTTEELNFIYTAPNNDESISVKQLEFSSKTESSDATITVTELDDTQRLSKKAPEGSNANSRFFGGYIDYSISAGHAYPVELVAPAKFNDGTTDHEVDRLFAYSIGTMYRSFKSLLPYTDGLTGNWIYDTTKQTYVLASDKKFYLDYENETGVVWDGSVEVQLTAEDTPLIQKIIFITQKEGKKVTYTHTFDKYGSVSTGVKVHEENLIHVDKLGDDPQSASPTASSSLTHASGFGIENGEEKWLIVKPEEFLSDTAGEGLQNWPDNKYMKIKFTYIDENGGLQTINTSDMEIGVWVTHKDWTNLGFSLTYLTDTNEWQVIFKPETKLLVETEDLIMIRFSGTESLSDKTIYPVITFVAGE